MTSPGMPESPTEHATRSSRPGVQWTGLDLAAFGAFSAPTVIFLPLLLVWMVRLFQPGFEADQLTAVHFVVFQGIMDLALVAFIVFLVKAVHGMRFLEAIQWFPDYPFANGTLVALGALLAITVLLVSSWFPPGEPPPIENLMASPGAIYVFAVFGIGVAPFLEEVIFRGFVFTVLANLGGSSLAVPATAALFAGLHAPQLWGSWAGITLIFVVGYVLSLARDRSGSLIPSFIIHTAYNATLFAAFGISTLAQEASGMG